MRVEPTAIARLAALLEGPTSPLTQLRHAIHAHRLAGAESFTELLSLARLIGVERHGYQIETVHRVLRTLRREHGDAYRQTHALTSAQREVMAAIEACRTAVLGGHVDVCTDCGYARPAYNSCRNRHCPKCQALAQARWIEQRKTRILPTHYFHVVFTLPLSSCRCATAIPGGCTICCSPPRATACSSSARADSVRASE